MGYPVTRRFAVYHISFSQLFAKKLFESSVNLRRNFPADGCRAARRQMAALRYTPSFHPSRRRGVSFHISSQQQAAMSSFPSSPPLRGSATYLAGGVSRIFGRRHCQTHPSVGADSPGSLCSAPVKQIACLYGVSFIFDKK